MFTFLYYYNALQKCYWDRVCLVFKTLHQKWSFPLTADLVTFTEEILNGKLYFLHSERPVVDISKTIIR